MIPADIDLTRFAVMMAAQHSGTRLLRGCFNSHPEIYCSPEIRAWGKPVPAQEYYQWFQRANDPRIIVVDVKYNQITEPLEEILQQLPVLHLVRRDIEAMYFSGKYEPGKSKVEFKEEELKSVTSYVIRGRKRFGYLAQLTLFYEELTAGNQNVTVLSEWASACLCAWLGVEPRILHAQMRKIAPTDYKKLWRR